MASATLLYVGEDFCHRIPVMEKAGLAVYRSDCAIGAVKSALTPGGDVAAIAFQNDVYPISDEVVSVARELSIAPLILFEKFVCQLR